jgi:hypothetical protein
MMKHMHRTNQAAVIQQLPEQQPSELEQQFATTATNNNKEEDGNLMGLPPVGYSGTRAGRGSVGGSQQLHGAGSVWEWQLPGRWRLSRGGGRGGAASAAPRGGKTQRPEAGLSVQRGGARFQRKIFCAHRGGLGPIACWE